jgi:hypothetical protein
MSGICTVSDGTRVEYFDTLHWGRLCMGMEKYTPNRARFFVLKKYTTFSTERIVALRSVNKIFPGSDDFAARTLSVYANIALTLPFDLLHFIPI